MSWALTWQPFFVVYIEKLRAALEETTSSRSSKQAIPSYPNLFLQGLSISQLMLLSLNNR